MSNAKTLPLFYRAVLGWIINPSNNPYEFNNSVGLCDNLEYGYASMNYPLYVEQRELFKQFATDYICPFGGFTKYCDESSTQTIYRNHERVNFVVEQVVSPELRKVMHQLHADLLAGKVIGDSLCFLPGVTITVRLELQQLFKYAGLDIGYPFNAYSGEYWNDETERTHYVNPARLHFVSVLAGKPGTLDHLAAK